MPTPPWELLHPALVGTLVVVALLAVMRAVHPNELRLTWEGLVNPRGMWFGRHVEGGRTLGVALSHMMGLVGWGIIGWSSGLGAENELNCLGLVPFSGWNAFGLGAALGLLLLPLRGASRGIAGWMAESQELTWQHAETDRLLRNALSVVLALEVLMIAVQSRVEWEVIAWRTVFWWSAGGYVVLRSIRLLQLLLFSGLSIGWGIAYLCTLELIPSWVLFSALLER